MIGRREGWSVPTYAIRGEVVSGGFSEMIEGRKCLTILVLSKVPDSEVLRDARNDEPDDGHIEQQHGCYRHIPWHRDRDLASRRHGGWDGEDDLVCWAEARRAISHRSLPCYHGAPATRAHAYASTVSSLIPILRKRGVDPRSVALPGSEQSKGGHVARPSREGPMAPYASLQAPVEERTGWGSRIPESRR